MGQDREFTKKEKIFALEAVFKFKKYWEDFENQKLIADRDSLVEEKLQDEEKFNEEIVITFKEKEDNMVENFINPPPPEEKEVEEKKDDKGKKDDKKKSEEEDEEPESIDYDQRAIDIMELKLKFQLDLLKENETFK
jgi:hypothetical protein